MPANMLDYMDYRRRRSRSPTMQRRHYDYVAAIIAAIPCDVERHFTTEHFADHLARTNPDFDRARFVRACNARDD